MARSVFGTVSNIFFRYSSCSITVVVAQFSFDWACGTTCWVKAALADSFFFATNSNQCSEIQISFNELAWPITFKYLICGRTNKGIIIRGVDEKAQK